MSTPKLRFPEFVNDGEWSDTELGNLALFVNEKITINHLTINNYVSTENILPDYAGLVPASKLPSVENATRFKVSDILISNIRPYLKKVSLAEIDGGSSNDVIVVRASTKVNPIYLSYILRNDSFIEYVMNGAKGVKMPRGDISMIKEYPVPYPKPEEQQKIADCLSSLDDLITAQNQKVEALKQHKKGLMQQLFPADGEIVPKLRFPEFSKLWTKTPLGMLCSSISSGRDQLDIDGRYELYGSTSIIGKTINPSFQGERILVARVGANAGFLTKANGVFGVTDNTLVISLNSSINIDYLYYYLGNVNINKLIFGSGQPLITGSILKALDIPVPIEPEQKKISDCLLSLDEVIAGQNSKLESLMTLKKGLMQQLFPDLKRVEV